MAVVGPKMINPIHAITVLSVSILLFGCGSRSHPVPDTTLREPLPSRQFDPSPVLNLLSPQFLTRLSPQFGSPEVQIQGQGNAAEVRVDYPLVTQNEDDYYSCIIKIEPGGTTLTPSAVQRHNSTYTNLVAQLPEQIAGIARTNEKARLAMRLIHSLKPITIGSRAVSMFLLTPQGGVSRVIFTTSDEMFDVSLDIRSHFTAGVSTPAISLTNLATSISTMYNERPNN